MAFTLDYSASNSAISAMSIIHIGSSDVLIRLVNPCRRVKYVHRQDEDTQHYSEV